MSDSRRSLVELASIFLRLGAVAFGGPAAHIAMMRTEFVERRRWIADSEFLDLVGASNLLPGPGSTEVAILLGMRECGWSGLLVAGVCFILPAALIVSVIAFAYVRLGHLPQTASVLFGIKPVIIAIVAQALWALGRSALKSRLLAATAAAALAASFLGVAPLIVLFGCGALHGVKEWARNERSLGLRPLRTLAIVGGVLAALPALLAGVEPRTAAAPRLSAIFLVFAKIGSIVFGSGYVLLAFLRDDLTSRLHWLSASRLLDAVAVGQFTPGPVFTTATFIGFVLRGPAGALAATAGIFAPAFGFVALSGPLLPRMRRSKTAGAFLDGVNAAAMALMAFVTLVLARAALTDIAAAALAAASLVVLIRWRINSAWLVLIGALAGLVLHR